ncbi:MAG: GAF domain-containing protein [Chloroflexi bacterium]|nr:GAF domain-containing protein [Chloroflexota bacterium]
MASPWYLVAGIVAAGLLLGALAYFAYSAALQRRRLLDAEGRLEKASQRQRMLLHTAQTFVQAEEEAEIVSLVLRLCQETFGAASVSFVPLDDLARPLAAVSQGELPPQVGNDWLEYLATPEVRHSCAGCNRRGEMVHVCPLIRESVPLPGGIYCLPLRRNQSELGVLNIYLPAGRELDGEDQELLRVILDEAALALDGLRLRTRAIATLRHIQSLRRETDLKGLLAGLLESLHQTLNADYALAAAWDSDPAAAAAWVTYGEPSEPVRQLLEGVARSVFASSEAALLEYAPGGAEPAAGVRSIIAAPMLLPDGAASGVILAASCSARGFTPRQLMILQTITGQAALVVQNVRLARQLEFQAALEERSRLAREIHDGLAQTLGFLKLKLAQLRGFLEVKEDLQAEQTVETCYQVVAEAYQDARQAIDGLRINSFQDGLAGWLERTAEEFHELSGVPVHVYQAEKEINLLPETQAQVIRIVQEALTNVRKHARASLVEISGRRVDGQLYLEVRDDGIGFLAGDLPSPSQHGLRSMRERADLIGADFQVTSLAEGGVSVTLRIPLEADSAQLGNTKEGRI